MKYTGHDIVKKKQMKEHSSPCAWAGPAKPITTDHVTRRGAGLPRNWPMSLPAEPGLPPATPQLGAQCPLHSGPIVASCSSPMAAPRTHKPTCPHECPRDACLLRHINRMHPGHATSYPQAHDSSNPQVSLQRENPTEAKPAPCKPGAAHRRSTTEPVPTMPLLIKRQLPCPEKHAPTTPAPVKV